jgi:hypothetical protein
MIIIMPTAIEGASWSEYIIAPLFMAVIVATKGIFGEGQQIEDPILWADVAANVVGYEVAKLFTEMALDQMMTSGIMIEGTNRVVEPAIQGVVNAMIPHMGINKKRLVNPASLVERQGAVALVLNESFMGKFIDGALFNILTTWLSSPITDAL